MRGWTLKSSEIALNFAYFWPTIFWRRAPKRLNPIFKAQPTADHGTKLRGDRPTELGDSVANKKSPAHAKGNAQQRCMFESPVQQNLSLPIFATMFYYSRQRAADDRRLIIYKCFTPEGVTCLALSTPCQL